MSEENRMMDQKRTDTGTDLVHQEATEEKRTTPSPLNEPSPDEELAAEVAPDFTVAERARENAHRPHRFGERNGQVENDETEAKVDPTPWLSWSGLAISILALFMFPIVMGSIGAILGFIGYRRGAKTAGMWAMGIGILAVIGALVLSPFIVR